MMGIWLVLMSFFNKLVVLTLPFVPKSIVYIFAKKYIAGPSLDHAINAIKDFNQKGIMATVDILGEEIEKKDAFICSSWRPMVIW